MKKQVFALFAFCVLFTLATFPAFASPMINEFSSADSSDWIEIYNSGTDTVDLSLYRIKDLTANNKLDLSGSLTPSGFAAFDWSNKLNNGGDLIKLVLISDESIVDQISYGNQGGIAAPSSSQTGGRQTDGDSNWAILTTASKGSSNNSSSVFTPPSPTPTKTPTPTKSPIPTKIPTEKPVSPAKTTPSKTPTPGKIEVSSSVKNSNPSQGNNKSVKIANDFGIASDFARVKNVSQTPEKKIEKVAVLGANKQNFSVFIILGGLVCLIAAGLVARRSIKEFALKIYEEIFNK